MEILSRVHLPIAPTMDDEVARLFEIKKLEQKLDRAGLTESSEKVIKPGEAILTISLNDNGVGGCEDYVWVRMNFTERMTVIDPYTKNSYSELPKIFIGIPNERVEWVLSDNPLWIMDDDGWFYWGEAVKCEDIENITVNSLLESVKLKKRTALNIDYCIDAHIETIKRDLSNFNKWILPDLIGDKSEGSYNPGVSDEIKELLHTPYSDIQAVQPPPDAKEIPLFPNNTGVLQANILIGSDGVYYTIGNNLYGELSVGDYVDRTVLTKMLWDATTPMTRDNVVDMRLGAFFACFKKPDGTWWGVGDRIPSATTKSAYPIQMRWSATEYMDDTNVKKMIAVDNGGYVLGFDNKWYSFGSASYNTKAVTSYHPAVLHTTEGIEMSEDDIENFTCADGYGLFFVNKSENLWYSMFGNSYGGGCVGSTTESKYAQKMMWSADNYISGTTKVFNTKQGTTYLLKEDGTWWAAGKNTVHSLVCDGTTTDRTFPVRMKWSAAVGDEMTSANVKKTVFSGNENWILKSDGFWYAFGYNAFGQLSDGTTTGTTTKYPKKCKWDADTYITEESAPIVYVKNAYVQIIKPDGSLWSVGQGAKYLLMDGTAQYRTYPVQSIWLDGKPIYTNALAYAVGEITPEFPMPPEEISTSEFLGISIDGFTLKNKKP